MQTTAEDTRSALIAPDRCHELAAQGKAVLVDVRAPEQRRLMRPAAAHGVPWRLLRRALSQPGRLGVDMRAWEALGAALQPLQGRRIVLCGNTTDPVSAGCYLALCAAGVRNVCVLDGGFTALKRNEPATRAASGDHLAGPGSDATSASRTPVVATADEVMDVLDRFESAVLLDVRTEPEFRGFDMPAPGWRAGHLPLAAWLYWGELLAATGAMVPAATAQAMFLGRGVTPDKTVVLYGSHWTHAAVAFLALRRLGYPDVRVFAGFRPDGRSHPRLPLELG